LSHIGEFLVKDPRPAAVAGDPQAVGGFLADRAGKRVCPAPLALRRRNQLDNPGGTGAEFSRPELVLGIVKCGLDLAPAEPGGSSPARRRARSRAWRDLRRRGPGFRSLPERAGGVGMEPRRRRRVASLRERSAQHFTHDRGVRRPPVWFLFQKLKGDLG
jgi:hypothetical protein